MCFLESFAREKKEVLAQDLDEESEEEDQESDGEQEEDEAIENG